MTLIEDALEEIDTENLSEQYSLETNNNLLKIEKKNVVKYPLFEYLTSARRNFSLIFVFITLVLSQGCYSVCDYWIRYWTEEEVLRNRSKHSYYHVHSNETINPDIYEIVSINNEEKILFRSNIIIYIYVILIGSAIVLTIIRSAYFFSISHAASKIIHEKVIDKIFSTPLQFFEKNTSGDILNRFSKDLTTINETLPDNFYEMLQVSNINKMAIYKIKF